MLNWFRRLLITLQGIENALDQICYSLREISYWTRPVDKRGKVPCIGCGKWVWPEDCPVRGMGDSTGVMYRCKQCSKKGKP